MRQYFRFNKSFLGRKNIAGLLKTAFYLAVNHAPVNQIALKGVTEVENPTEDTRLFVSNENILEAYDVVHDRREVSNPTRIDQAKKVKKPAKASRGQRAGERAPAGRGHGRAGARPADARCRSTSRSTARPVRTTPTTRRASTRSRTSDGSKHHAYRIVDLDRRARRVLRRAGHDLEGPADAGQPRPRARAQRARAAAVLRRLEAAHGRRGSTPRGAYYVSNTLSRKLSNAQMLAIASSLQAPELLRARLSPPAGYEALMLLRSLLLAAVLALLAPAAASAAACPGADPCPYAASADARPARRGRDALPAGLRGRARRLGLRRRPVHARDPGLRRPTARSGASSARPARALAG